MEHQQDDSARHQRPVQRVHAIAPPHEVGQTVLEVVHVFAPFLFLDAPAAQPGQAQPHAQGVEACDVGDAKHLAALGILPRAALNLRARLRVVKIVRVQPYGFLYVVERAHVVAHAVMGQGAQVIPLRIARAHLAEDIQRFLVAHGIDVTAHRVKLVPGFALPLCCWLCRCQR